MTALLAAVLPQLVQAVIPVVGLAASWLILKLRSKMAADEKASKYALAAQKLLDLSIVYGQRVWPKLEAEFQQAMADGSLDQNERTHLEDILKAEVLNVFDQKTLDGLASDLGVPFSGLVATIATRVLQLVIKAHDPADPTPKALFALPLLPTGPEPVAEPAAGMG